MKIGTGTLILLGVILFLLLSKQNKQNEEEWNWTDWRGQERKIVVHRNVRAIG